ncbi:sodium-dependent lysophosphatidylcholine symporter 1-like [Dreissena polymorpha]|uniref:sodium-dependent lysophosphatidylcholine symporter 1-like n=1 Tax=Dreissena polymorpha TaxID=45954 RepID=UPI00226462CE|nr:sodium-dependent lysophosphatidylcholine symporter 1-like [Dreissena polymorpha]
MYMSERKRHALSRKRTIPPKPLIIVEQTVPAADEPLPLWQKLCFAVGGAPYQTTNTVINFFISIILFEVAEIEPYYVSIIMFTGKAWYAATDPTCGFLVHRKDTRFGKFRPWILFSAPFSCGAYFCLWYVPNFSVEGKFAWYFCFYCSFQMFLSGLTVPYTSMTMTVTSSQKDGIQLPAYRMVLEAVGVLVSVLVQGQLVAKYRKTGDCGKAGEITDQMLKDEKWSYVLGAIIVVSAYLLCACTVFFGSKEKPGFTTAETSGFFSGARQVITFKPYMLLCASFMFQSLAIAIVQGNLALYCTHAVDMSDQFSTIILVLLSVVQLFVFVGMVLEAVGVLVAVLVQGQLVAKYRKTGDCGKAGEITDQMLKDEKWSYVLGAIIVVSAYLLCACTVFFGSKEKPGFTTAETSGFFSGARQVITFKPYMLLCASFMFQSLAIAIVQGNLALYCTHAVDMSDQFSTIILVLLVTAILAMPLWQICVGKFGKKSTFAAGMILLIPALISLMYIPKYVMYPVVVIAGVAVSVALLLPWSMLPDVIGEFYLQHGTRKESIFYSFYVFFNKLSMGVGLGISQAVLGIGGYKTGECVQPSSVGLALKMLMVPGPVVMTLVALVALWFYPIDESRRRHLKDEIKRRIESRSSTLIKPQSNTHQEYASVSYRSITESSGV